MDVDLGPVIAGVAYASLDDVEAVAGGLMRFQITPDGLNDLLLFINHNPPPVIETMMAASCIASRAVMASVRTPLIVRRNSRFIEAAYDGNAVGLCFALDRKVQLD